MLTEAVYKTAERRSEINWLPARQVASDSDITWVQEESPFPINREWGKAKFELPGYDYINKAAYFDFQREWIMFT